MNGYVEIELVGPFTPIIIFASDDGKFQVDYRPIDWGQKEWGDKKSGRMYRLFEKKICKSWWRSYTKWVEIDSACFGAYQKLEDWIKQYNLKGQKNG